MFHTLRTAFADQVSQGTTIPPFLVSRTLMGKLTCDTVTGTQIRTERLYCQVVNAQDLLQILEEALMGQTQMVPHRSRMTVDS